MLTSLSNWIKQILYHNPFVDRILDRLFVYPIIKFLKFVYYVHIVFEGGKIVAVSFMATLPVLAILLLDRCILLIDWIHKSFTPSNLEMLIQPFFGVIVAASCLSIFSLIVRSFLGENFSCWRSYVRYYKYTFWLTIYVIVMLILGYDPWWLF